MLIYFALILIICADFLIEYILRQNKVLDKEGWFCKVIKIIFKYRIISLIAIVFVSTFKALNVGLDTYSYYNYYINLKFGKKPLFTPISSKYEIGYTFLNSLLVILNMPFNVLLFLISTFVTISFILFINKFSNYKSMSLILYIMLGVFAQSLSANRQIIAMAFIVLSLMFIFDKKWIKAIILILCGSLFHISAIICLILIPLRYFKLNWKSVTIAFVGTTLISLIFPQIIKLIEILTPVDYYTRYFVNYTEYIQKTDIVNILYSIGLIVVFMGVYLGRNFLLKFYNEKEDEGYNLFLNIYLFVPLIRIIGYVTNAQALFNRVSMYFFVSLIILIPQFVNGLKQNKRLYNGSFIIVYGVALMYMIYLYAIQLSCGVVPYVFSF